MARLVRAISLFLSMVLLVFMLFCGSCIHRQLGRDRECVSDVHRTVGVFEAFRKQHGRLPQNNEVRDFGMPVIRMQPQPNVGVQAGAEQYVLTFWRGEWEVDYFSSTGVDTCSSGAWTAAAWLFGLAVPPFCLFTWWGLRKKPRRTSA